MTATMVHRPLKLPSYIQFRSYYQVEDFDFNDRAQVIVQIMNSIRAVVTVPLVGAILAQIAAIHTQRCTTKFRTINLSQTLALANRGWTEPWLVWQALIRGSMILPLGALMVLICMYGYSHEHDLYTHTHTHTHTKLIYISRYHTAIGVATCVD